jgi:hypothetical protein
MSNNWNEKTEVKKGNVGESVVDTYLIKQGLIPYAPNANGAHPFDRLVASKDKKTIFIAESKAKPARVIYPDQGINVRNYEDYKRIQEKHGIDVFLFFVDEDRGTVYGNLLSVLDKPRLIHNIRVGASINYPLVEGGIRYFPLEAMEQIGPIPEEELALLRKYSTRNPQYTEIARQSNLF